MWTNPKLSASIMDGFYQCFQTVVNEYIGKLPYLCIYNFIIIAFMFDLSLIEII